MKNNSDSIDQLNASYVHLKPLQRLEKLFNDFDREDILVTSSFGTTSGILMGMVSLVAPGHPIHFIDTTFCFRRTIEYKNTLTDLLGLHIINILPEPEDNLHAREVSLWDTNKDLCCFVNKIKPFEPYKIGKKIWVSGLLMNQTPFRENLRIFEQRPSLIKMHPNIDTTAEGFEAFLRENGIPPHPLKLQGYDSVGCTHCTIRGKGREGRWANSSKMECGIHV